MRAKQPRGRRVGRSAQAAVTHSITVRVDTKLLDALNRRMRELQQERQGMLVSQSDTIRFLLRFALSASAKP